MQLPLSRLYRFEESEEGLFSIKKKWLADGRQVPCAVLDGEEPKRE
jgi:hypothetical protein